MSDLIEIAPPPGIIRDSTANASTRWYDCDKVRFRQGFPEKIGGWTRATLSPFLGVCRSIHQWSSLIGTAYRSVGTNLKIYRERGGTLTDITPIRSSATLGANPFQTVSGSPDVTVTHSAHGAVTGDFVTFSGASAVGGITISGEYQISVINGNSYRITHSSSASSGATGGGASVSAAYQINTASSSAVFGTGWGTGTWGRGTWGSSSTSRTLSSNLRTWTQDNWGEDLVFCPRYGGIFYWDLSAGGRGVNVSTLPGASQAPLIVTEVLTVPDSGQVMALGVNPEGSSVFDPMYIRWTDYESPAVWGALTTNAAGGFRLTAGSEIVTGLRTAKEILVWTDTSLYSITFIKGVDIFRRDLIDANVNIIGHMAKAAYKGVVFWMGKGGFYAYNGRVSSLPCSVEDYVFGNINTEQVQKTHCAVNSLFGEITWYYPSVGSSETDRYVTFNVDENCWYYGALTRTAWADRGISSNPVAAAADGYLYLHESGLDDGSTNPPSAISAFVETAPFEIPSQGGKGSKFYFISKLVPDITFRASTNASPSVTYTLKKNRYPGGQTTQDERSVLMESSVNQYTDYANVRLRGRAFSFRVSSNQTGVDWRLGSNRFQIRTDGSR